MAAEYIVGSIPAAHLLVPQSPIQLMPWKFDVVRLREYLADHPSWNRFKARTNNPASPHREADDIWARYGDISQSNFDSERGFECFWLEPDLRVLIEPITNALMERTAGLRLGGVLITRIPAGKQVYPHTDKGWHATTFSKYCVCVSANEEQSFCYRDKELRTRSGEVFWFDNSQEHWVINSSSVDRISAIVCIETPQGIHLP